MGYNAFNGSTLTVKNISTRKPWYSAAYGDLVDSSKSTPWGNKDLKTWKASRTVGKRYYEMTDHLGNVLATVMDRKTGHLPQGGGIGSLYDYWQADLASVQDYYPGGMLMPGRHKEAFGDTAIYRYGSQGEFKDDEVYGFGNLYAFDYRMQDARLNRFWSPDPLRMKYPWNSDYAFAENKLVQSLEMEGLEAESTEYLIFKNSSGKTEITVTNDRLTGQLGYGNNGIYVGVRDETNNINGGYYVADVVVRPAPLTDFQKWTNLQKKAWRNGWEGSIGYEAVGQHIVPVMSNALSLLVGLGELNLALKTRNAIGITLASADVAITSDNLLAGGNSETPLESVLPNEGKIGLNALKTVMAGRGVIQGIKGLRNSLHSANRATDIGMNIYSTGSAMNDLHESGKKTSEGLETKKQKAKND